MNLILVSVLSLGGIGAVSAIILYFISQKFQVEEDSRIEEVEAALPGANCGGCGFPGCRAFAAACVKADSLENLACPVGGMPTMEKVANILGKTAMPVEPLIAVVRCGGSCGHRERTNRYDGVKSCAIVHNLYGGEPDCSWGCLGYGDCENSCTFDAIHINPITLLPEVDEEKCTACGACVKACPKNIIQLRKKGHKSRRIYVNCVNQDKGAVNKKVCDVACIGCSKCFNVCAYDAISIHNNLAYIDDKKCTLCRKCVEVCPTNSILELNFPPRKPKVSGYGKKKDRQEKTD
jgi:Na+-translocating ferredoxin:NAD+ oxidoreductase RNF subunit RnfB